MRIAILSNANLDILAKQMCTVHEVYETEGFGQWVQYALAPNEGLLAFGPKAIFLLIDGISLLGQCASAEQGVDEIARALSHVDALARSYPQCSVVVSNIDIPHGRIKAAADEDWRALWEWEWARGLQDAVAEHANIVPFDLKRVLCDMGRDAAYSSKMWYAGSIPYSMKGMSAMQAAMCEMLEGLGRSRKKVLVLDLDNTLWGGVVGEDGPEGIVLAESGVGAAYRDAQKRLKQLAETGVLLAVVSKNNPEDADAAFHDNPFMVLAKDDFVSFKANWQAKAENVAAMAAELNLGIDSFVFLDDNPVEREQMASMLPEVAVVDFPKDVSRLPEVVSSLYQKYFWIPRRTAEDATKTQQYHDEAKRVAVREAASSMEEYLKSLQIDMRIREAGDNQMQRVVQLLNKTNQFNTNTVRMDAQEMAGWLAREGNHALVANVSDRYGDSGLVVIMLVELGSNGKHEATIVNFLMSCRVMGRQIEDAFMNAACSWMSERGIRRVCSSWVRSAKNKPVENLYERLGFDLVECGEDAKAYLLALPARIESVVEARWER